MAAVLQRWAVSFASIDLSLLLLQWLPFPPHSFRFCAHNPASLFDAALMFCVQLLVLTCSRRGCKMEPVKTDVAPIVVSRRI